MIKKRHILVVIDSLRGGGAEQIVSYLLNGLDAEKYRFSLYLSLDPKIDYKVPENINIYSSHNHELISSTDLDDEIEEKIEKISKYYNFRYYGSQQTYDKKREEMEKFLGDIFISSKVLNGVIQKDKPDLIFSCLINSNLIVLLHKYLYNTDIPICCSDHNTLSQEIKSLPYPFLYKLSIKYFYKKADYHIAVSEQAKNDLSRHFGISLDKITTIYNGIDVVRIEKESRIKIDDDIKSVLNNSDTIKIITSGRLTKQKNQELLIRAFCKIEQSANIKLLILGEGEKQEELKELTRKLGNSENVLFLGWRDNPFNIIAACDFFVLSSNWEGMPLVILEAMSLGVPIISTDCPSGPREILDNGKYGVLVRRNSISKLSHAISNLISDKIYRNELSQKSAVRVKDFTLGKMLKNYDDFLSRIII